MKAPGLALVALLAAAGPVAAEEAVPPDTAYVATWTFLGAAGGGALGSALGGLSRPTGADPVVPFVRWGGIGAAFGGLLGYEVARNAASVPPDDTGLPPPPTRESGACFGAVIGELVGLGVGSALGQPVDADARQVWAGISLGALLGAGSGFLFKPMPFLAAPRAVPLAVPRLNEPGTAEALQPLIAPGAGGARAVREAEIERDLPPSPAAPEQLRALNRSLLNVEEARRLPETVPLDPLRHSVLLPDPLPVSPEEASLLQLVEVLAILEGGAAGGTAAGSLADIAGVDTLQAVSVGGVAGALIGWSAGSALSAAWGTSSGEETVDRGERMAGAQRSTGLFVGGLGGTLVGLAAGGMARNAHPDLPASSVARYGLVGNLAGVLVGYVFQTLRE